MEAQHLAEIVNYAPSRGSEYGVRSICASTFCDASYVHYDILWSWEGIYSAHLILLTNDALTHCSSKASTYHSPRRAATGAIRHAAAAATVGVGAASPIAGAAVAPAQREPLQLRHPHHEKRAAHAVASATTRADRAARMPPPRRARARSAAATPSRRDALQRAPEAAAPRSSTASTFLVKNSVCISVEALLHPTSR